MVMKERMEIFKENRKRKSCGLWHRRNPSYLRTGVQLGSRQGGSGGACDQDAARATQ